MLFHRSGERSKETPRRTGNILPANVSGDRGRYAIASVLLVLVLTLVSVVRCSPVEIAPGGARRVALVIGNGAYRGDIPALTNPRRDASAVAASLRRDGYETFLLLDADRSEMLSALRSFAASTTGADMSFIFYSGHGVEINGHNLLLPIDFDLSKASSPEAAENGAVSIAEIDQILGGSAKASIIFLDACRTDPFVMPDTITAANVEPPRSLPPIAGRGQGLALEGGKTISAIVYSAQPGKTAMDGVGEFSPFTTAFLANLLRRGQTVGDFLSRLAIAVKVETNSQQIPTWAAIDGPWPRTHLSPSAGSSPSPNPAFIVRIATTQQPAKNMPVDESLPASIVEAFKGQVLISEHPMAPTEYLCRQEKHGYFTRTLIVNRNGPSCGGSLYAASVPMFDLQLVVRPKHGRVSIQSNTFAYRPDAEFSGQDYFEMTARGVKGLKHTRVTVQVQ